MLRIAAVSSSRLLGGLGATGDGYDDDSRENQALLLKLEACLRDETLQDVGGPCTRTNESSKPAGQRDVPETETASGAQDPEYLTQSPRLVGPVMKRNRRDHEIDGGAVDGHRFSATDME